MSSRVAIWGASGHARVVVDALRLSEPGSVAGFLDDNPARVGENFAGGRILGGQSALDDLLRDGVRRIHIAIGHCGTRVRLAALARARGFELCAIVHPSAIIASDAEIGAGSFLAAGTIVNAAARVSENVIVNTRASIDHECQIHDGVHVGPGATLGGGVVVGNETWLGIGTQVSQLVRIGARSIVGAGSVVVREIPDNVVAYGVPARVMRAKSPTE